jgi:hypothetical protein
LQYFNNQSLLNKGGLVVRLHNANLCRYYENLGNLKPLEFGKNAAFPSAMFKSKNEGIASWFKVLYVQISFGYFLLHLVDKILLTLYKL